jgi:hypothetical protein
MDVRTLTDEKLASILSFLITFGYVDGKFHATERKFVVDYLATLLPPLLEATSPEPRVQEQVRARLNQLLDGTYQRLTTEIEELAEEGPRADDGGAGFVFARLKVRCLDMFGAFAAEEQTYLLRILEHFMLADGRVAPEEKKVRDELVALMKTTTPAPDATTAGVPSISLWASQWNPRKMDDHSFHADLEHPFSPHPTELMSQTAREVELIERAIAVWNDQRGRGAGRLRGVQRITDLPFKSWFLDGFVYARRVDPIRPSEVIVVGDLHGCYACLKGVLLQSDFLRRAWLHQWDPVTHPEVKLVFLGDYIDRGLYSFDGVLRTVLQLMIAMPDDVVVLRGNHELFLDTRHGIRSAVYPAEAIASLQPHVSPELIRAYKRLFDAMPTAFACERTLVVHAGIPRDDTFQAYADLASLNAPDMRFQMMWSDPVKGPHVPLELQLQNARFSFGWQQFRAFMERTGFQTMIRGHEKVEEGFRVVYALGDRFLFNLFSAGGAENVDLPLVSSYRTVTPMALTLRYENGHEHATPWPIDWAAFNAPARNGFLRGQPALAFRTA